MSTPILVIGASAGGVEAVERLVAGLPRRWGACVLVTVHIAPTARGYLPRILTRAGPLPAVHATDGAVLEPDTILVAPPDRHLLIDRGRVRLGEGPGVNRHRPSIDVMFASAARWAGPDVVATVLSGTLDDGAVGAALVVRAGGRVFVQDPAEARFPNMPEAARAAVPGATVAPVTRMGNQLAEAIRSRPGVRHAAPVDGEGSEMGSMTESGDPLFLAADESSLTRLTCPDCHGSLARIDLETVSYFRCHVGHQWASQSLSAAQGEAAESALWTAVAVLEEQSALGQQLAAGEQNAAAAEEYLRAADRAGSLIRLLRSHLHSRSASGEPPTGVAAGDS